MRAWEANFTNYMDEQSGRLGLSGQWTISSPAMVGLARKAKIWAAVNLSGVIFFIFFFFFLLSTCLIGMVVLLAKKNETQEGNLAAACSLFLFCFPMCYSLTTEPWAGSFAFLFSVVLFAASAPHRYGGEGWNNPSDNMMTGAFLDAGREKNREVNGRQL
jgi:hypothetical protein